MWCADCQQDVPAVARTVHDSLVCPRCQNELVANVATGPSDAGVELESFDLPTTENLAPPIDWQSEEETRQRLRRIDRTLNSSYRPESASKISAGLQHSWSDTSTPPPLAIETSSRTIARHAKSQPTRKEVPNKTSWLLSSMLGLGVLSFLTGVGLLVWSAAFQFPQLWQPGMTLTICAEGLLILSLTWMAARLWRNGRNVNHQLNGVDQQLAEIEQITGSLAGSRQSSSQHYYHHFSQAASPHMLVANLRGQVDQMASRMASER